jgi:hypothetical protein
VSAQTLKLVVQHFWQNQKWFHFLRDVRSNWQPRCLALCSCIIIPVSANQHEFVNVPLEKRAISSDMVDVKNIAIPDVTQKEHVASPLNYLDHSVCVFETFKNREIKVAISAIFSYDGANRKINVGDFGWIDRFGKGVRSGRDHQGISLNRPNDSGEMYQLGRGSPVVHDAISHVAKIKFATSEGGTGVGDLHKKIGPLQIGQGTSSDRDATASRNPQADRRSSKNCCDASQKQSGESDGITRKRLPEGFRLAALIVFLVCGGLTTAVMFGISWWCGWLMAVQKLGFPTTIGIHPSADRKLFRFRLEFREQVPQRLVEFETSADGAMGIMKALQNLQARHRIPIPANLRPKGRILRIVQPDE